MRKLATLAASALAAGLVMGALAVPSYATTTSCGADSGVGKYCFYTYGAAGTTPDFDFGST